MFQVVLNLSIHKDYHRIEIHAGLETNNGFFILCYEIILSFDELIWLLLKVELEQNLEKCIGIEFKEEAQESLVGQKPHDIVHVASPLE